MSTHRWMTATALVCAMALNGCGGKDTGGVTDREREDNEAAAVAVLLNLVTCQNQIVDDKLIDCDADGEGEFGIIMELTGNYGLRTSYVEEPETGLPYSDLSKRAAPLSPSIMDPALGVLDSEGILVKSGYCFRLFLPDSADPPRFVHETVNGKSIDLKGGDARIGTDAAEKYWCAYAWPEKPGITGNRVFFINQDGKLLQSDNSVAGWGGKDKAPPGNSAYSKSTIASDPAELETGRDGDRWKAVR